MGITLEEITERIKGRINETVSSDINLPEVKYWIHSKLFEIFKELLPHTKWHGERVTLTADWVSRVTSPGAELTTKTINRFSDLVINAWIGANAYIWREDNDFYIDKVSSNTVDSIDIQCVSGIQDGEVICIISKASSQTLSEINLSSLDYYNLKKIVGPDGLIVKAKNEEELDIVPINKTVYANELRWWEYGRKIIFAKGEGAEYPSSVDVWYNRNPIKAVNNDDVLDMPDDWEEVLIGLVADVALKKLEGKAEEAARQRNEALGLLKQMEEASLKREALEKMEDEEA